MDKLTIKEYAKLHKVSMTTVRRRIKAGTLSARLEHGRYFIVGQADGQHPEQADTQSEQADSQPASVESVATGQSVLVDRLQSEVDYLREQLDKHVSLLAVTTQHNRELGQQLEHPAPSPVMTRIRGQLQRWGLVRSEQS